MNLVNSKGESALHYAVGTGFDNCVRSLLKYGSKVINCHNIGTQ